MIMEILTKPTSEDIADILNLFRMVPGRTCSASNYLTYLDLYWDYLVLVVIRDPDTGRINSFVQGSNPTLLNPKVGWIGYAYKDPKVSHAEALKAFHAVCDILKARGAECVRMNSVRKSNGLVRAWKLSASSEKTYELKLEELGHGISAE